MPASPSAIRDLAFVTWLRVRTSLPPRALVQWDRYAGTLLAALTKLHDLGGSFAPRLASFGDAPLDARPADALTRVWWRATRIALRGARADRSGVRRRLAGRLTRTVAAMQRLLDNQARVFAASRTLPLRFDRSEMDSPAG